MTLKEFDNVHWNDWEVKCRSSKRVCGEVENYV